MNDDESVEAGRSDATQVLSDYVQGDEQAAERLLPLVYEELKRIAATYLRDEREGHSLQPTAIVHEAYLHLVDIDRIGWNGRRHFLAMAARTMRRVLVDHARARGTDKRGGRMKRVELREPHAEGIEIVDALALEEALEELAGIDERQAQVIELRFFGGLTLDETAALCGVSRDTVKLDWRMARAWLNRKLSEGGEKQ